MMKNSPHSTWISDENGTLIKINSACCELLSVKKEDVIGKYNILKDNIVSEEGYSDLVRSVFEEGRTVRFTIQYETSRLKTIKLDKIDPLELDVTVFPIKDNAGNVTNAIIQHRDVTEQRHTENALSRASLEWKSTIDAVNDAVWVLDKDHRILHSNKTSEKLFSSTFEDIRGRYCWEVAHGTSEPAHDCPAARAKKTGQRNTTEMHVNGSWFEVIIDPIFDENHEYGGAVHIVSDITRRKMGQEALRENQRMLLTLMSNLPGMVYRCKNDENWTMEFVSDGCLSLTGYRAEKDVEKLKDQLSQAQKMESVGRLAGGVAHDFNNMLSAIIGNAELSLFELEPDTPLNNRTTQILEAANRSANITRQLLGFARKQTIRPIVMDLNTAVEEMLKMLRRLIGEDIELAWHPGRKLWRIKIDPAQIDQILANLCVNAKDAITSGAGKINIETGNVVLDEGFCALNSGAVPGEYVKLFLSDNGAGMNEEVVNNIFEPFFTTKEEGKGTGLGLSTVYGIVKQNNGFIDVHSRPGKGTLFKLYLPRYQRKNETTDEEIRNKVPRGNGETILIVEDEIMVLEIARIALENFGYKVLESDSPSRALGIVKEYPDKIDLLLTDLVMPEMNGKELSGKLMKIYPEIKTLYMSGYTPDRVVSHGVLEKDMYFIQKPFTVESLVRKVSSVFRETTGIL